GLPAPGQGDLLLHHLAVGPVSGQRLQGLTVEAVVVGVFAALGVGDLHTAGSARLVVTVHAAEEAVLLLGLGLVGEPGPDADRLVAAPLGPGALVVLGEP